MSKEVPVIDIQPLVQQTAKQNEVAAQIGRACRDSGFFYIAGHGVPADLETRLEDLSRQFFALPEAEKMKIRIELGGRAWRGYFPLGDELTSGKPDLKEGIYFGEELPEDDPKVQARTPMHGKNLFPEVPAGLKPVVLQYIKELTDLGHHLMRGLALSLGLEASFFQDRYTTDPLVLFRIFHYPAPADHPDLEAPWGVGEHTDYGVLTILKQDAVGGLQIKSHSGWIDAPYLPGTFVCNIGDMLDRMTGGLYRSTPHRVRNASRSGRLSFPFFFDPNFDARVEAIPLDQVVKKPGQSDEEQRWDGADLHAFAGTYGEYILNKVAKVFPQLRRTVDP